MNRVAKRSTITLLLVLFLLSGMVIFTGRFLGNGAEWAAFPGNPHISSGDLVVTDRDGTVLLEDLRGEKLHYADDAELRAATVHWLGDRSGSIHAPAVDYYRQNILDYSLVNGLYGYSNAGGRAVMTLSGELQKLALEAMDGRKGTIGVYNYKTGEILCAVSTPNFDPDNVPDIEGDTTGAYEGAYINRFTRSAYVPGSIFKIVTAAAALEELPDALEMEFTCEGSVDIGGEELTCEGTHGTIGLKTALARSCNCYFGQLAQVLGRDTLEKYVEKLQVTEPQSFDGITTKAGNYDLTGASDVQVSWSAIGQHTDLVNPCRYMTLMGVIAGGGEAAEPHLISRADFGDDSAYRAKPGSTGRLLSAETCETLQELLHNNVVRIYGEDNFPGMTVCAKSGTAQVGGDREPNATFSGFVMDEEYPLAFIVVVENGGSGSRTCVPILSKVLRGCRDLLDAE